LVLANLYYEPSSWQVAWSCFCLRRPFILTEEKKIIGGHLMARFFGSVFFFFSWPIFYVSKMVWAWTEPTADFLRRHVWLLNHKKVAVFPASINPKLFNAQGVVRADNGILKIVMVARFVAYKRHKDLFAALKYIKASNGPKFSLSLVGRGGEQQEGIKQAVIEAGLENEVDFLSVVPNEEMKAFYVAHDVFVLPSYNEAIGIVVPEAMACGLPVVVSDTCGGQTFVEDGVNGFIFKTFDYFDLAEKIVKLGDAARRQLMGERAAESIAKNYTNQVAAERFIQLAEKLF
jgi:glycosyltransferase involved in cell wall biosynthesis